MNILLLALMHFALTWVLVSQVTATLHKMKIHKFDSILCLKCITFFVTFFATGFNPYIAAIAALMAYIFDSQLNTTKL